MKKKSRKVDIIIIAVILLIIAAAVLAVMFAPNEEPSVNAPVGSAAEVKYTDYNGKRAGIITGTMQDRIVGEKLPDSPRSEFNNYPDMIAAIHSDKIDYFIADIDITGAFIESDPELMYIKEPVAVLECGAMFPKNDKGEKLRDRFNEFLAKANADGTWDEIQKFWKSDEAEGAAVDMSGLTGENGTLVLAVSGKGAPYSYISNGNIAGADPDLAVRFCREYGYGIDIRIVDFGGIIPGLTSGVYDFVVDGVIITEERKESVYFSDPYLLQKYDLVTLTRDNADVPAIAELNSPEKKVGYGTGTSGMFAVEKYLPDAQHIDYSDSLTGYEAVKLGKLDAFVFEKRQMQIAIDNGLTGVVLLKENLGEDTEVAVGLSRRSSIPDLQTKINRFIAELKADGTLDDMYLRWAVQGNYEMPELNKPQAPVMKIIVGTTGIVEPYSFYKDNALTGYDIEMAERFGIWMNAEIEYRTFDYAGVIAAAESGTIDCIFANLNITDERKETIDFSDPIYIMENSVMVSASNNVISDKASWLDSIAQSFEKNFIREDRWKMILDGIGTTCLITVMSTLFGTLLAFLICMFRRTGSALANAISNIYVKLLQGTPMVVLLMILYYVILGKSGLDAVWVAIIGFSLNVGAYVSEIMRTGIESIDGGQREAALALGYSENQAFFRFIFPQAAVRFLPVYKQEIVSLLKSTSIVGYIAIQDLTKMSDIIRSRTYEAFFPLIATAIIYFILAWIISIILKFVLKAISPKRKRGAAK